MSIVTESKEFADRLQRNEGGDAEAWKFARFGQVKTIEKSRKPYFVGDPRMARVISIVDSTPVGTTSYLDYHDSKYIVVDTMFTGGTVPTAVIKVWFWNEYLKQPILDESLTVRVEDKHRYYIPINGSNVFLQVVAFTGSPTSLELATAGS